MPSRTELKLFFWFLGYFFGLTLLLVLLLPFINGFGSSAPPRQHDDHLLARLNRAVAA